MFCVDRTPASNSCLMFTSGTFIFPVNPPQSFQLGPEGTTPKLCAKLND